MSIFDQKILSSLTLCLCASTVLVAQDRISLSGQVRSQDGELLPGVTVQILGTQRGTLTDASGRFSLLVSIGQTLRVTYVGMKIRDIQVTSPKMTITLYPDVKMVDEVVVTGYQRIKSRVYTGATSSVKLQDIKLEGINDVSRMLEGRVAGLSIQNVSGTFGSAPRINIRGGASIVGNVQPLWVIDGVVYEDLVPLTLDRLASGDAATLISSAVAGLNASDIADIQVFKDASATSVYGARALNGVVVVTTRSARRNTPTTVQYSTEYSWRMRPTYSQYDLLNSQETMSVYEEMRSKGYLNVEDVLYGRRAGIYNILYRGLSTYDPTTGKYVITNDEASRVAFLKDREYANTDWFRELFTLNPVGSHTLSLSSGSDRVATYASIGYLHDEGWSLADGVQRVTGNIKSAFFVSDRLSATLSTQGNIRRQKAPGTIPQRRNITLGVYEREFDINPFSYALSTSRTLRPYSSDGSYEYYRNNWAPFNILNEYQQNKMSIDVLDFKAQAEISYKPSSELELRALVSARSASTSTEHEVHEGSNMVQAWRAQEVPMVARQNVYLLHHPETPWLQPTVAFTHGGVLNRSETKLHSYLGRVSADYDKRIGRHDLKAFAFAELRSTDRSISPFSGYGIQYDRGNQVFTNPLIFDKLTSEGESYFGLDRRRDRGVTFSGSLTYGYAGRYIVNAILNYEGSNAAGAHSRNQWLPTWNVGAKWNLDQEPWLKDSGVLSKLALRASYGLTAKMNELAINSTAIYQNIIKTRYNLADRENALRLLHLENRDLTWEKMYELNVGVDAGWLNNRISASIDLYRRNAFDLIDLVRTSGIGGEYYKYANFGDMSTYGVELSLHTRNIDTGDWGWTTNLTLSAMHQEITRLRNTSNTFDLVAGRGRGNVVGYPRGSLFSFNFQGLTEQGLPTFDFGYYPLGSDAYAHSTGADFLDTQYSKSYLIYHGPIEPTIIGGLGNTLRYMGWELSCFVTAQAGNKIRINPTFDPSYGDLNVFSQDYYNRWLNHGDELKMDVPVIPSRDQIQAIGRESIEKAYSTYNFSQERVADGSFIRMKNIALGYTFSESVAHSLRLRSLALKLNVTNPFLIYSDSRLHGQDPEFCQVGGVALPIPRQWTITLNAGF